MATQNSKPPAATSFEVLDKSASNTLKRNPKMELTKTDLLNLLSYLEGELQAREIVIATLKADKAKQLFYQAKYGRFTLNDPFAALQRDSEGSPDTNFDENSFKAMYDNQLALLENLITQQRKAQVKMREQIVSAEKRQSKVVIELEDEKRKHAQDTAQGDDVTYLLEKERERLKQEVEFEKTQTKKQEKEVKKALQLLEEERQKHKEIVLLLLRERKRLVMKLVEEHQKNLTLNKSIQAEKGRIKNIAEDLMEESKKSLQKEAELEKQLTEYDSECEQLKICLSNKESKNNELHKEIERLQQELETLKHPNSDTLLSNENVDNSNTKTALVNNSVAASVTPPKIAAKPNKSVTSLSGHKDLSSNSINRTVQQLTNNASARTLVQNITTVTSTTEKSIVRITPSVPERSSSPQVSPRIGVSVPSGAKLLSLGSTKPINNLSNPGKKLPPGRRTPPPIPPNKPILIPQSIPKRDVNSRPTDSPSVLTEIKPSIKGDSPLKFGLHILKGSAPNPESPNDNSPHYTVTSLAPNCIVNQVSNANQGVSLVNSTPERLVMRKPTQELNPEQLDS